MLGPEFDADALQRVDQLDPGGHAGLMAQVMDALVQALSTQAQALDQAISTANPQMARRALHSLRSSCTSVGLLDLAQALHHHERQAASAPSGPWVQNAQGLDWAGLSARLNATARAVERVLGRREI